MTDLLHVEASCPYQSESFPNGHQTELTGTESDRVIHYTCLPGYHLKGNSTQICGTDGQWDPPNRPQCLKSSKLAHFYFYLELFT